MLRELIMNKKITTIPLILAFSVLISACGGNGEAAGGQELYFSRGCSACHARDDSYSIAPTFKGLYGSEVELADGSSVVVDDAYLLESILDPNAKIVAGFSANTMPAGGLTREDARRLVEYIKTIR